LLCAARNLRGHQISHESHYSHSLCCLNTKGLRRRELNTSALEEEKEPVTPLARLLKDTIKINGPLSTYSFMREVLLYPHLGYYHQANVFGQHGDFITSPDISQMFGEMIALWFMTQWEAAQCPSSTRIVELGPGKGTLLEDMLRTWKQFPSFWKTLRQLHLLEAGEELRKVQRAKFCDAAETTTDTRLRLRDAPETEVQWLERWDDVTKSESWTMYLAHEFFDALPIYTFQMSDTGWREIMVDLDGSKHSSLHFRFVQAPGSTPASVTLPRTHPIHQSFSKGEFLEISPDVYAISESMSSRIAEGAGGCALIIDYGGTTQRIQTLRGVRRHKFVSPLSSPGKVDVSTDVDFDYTSHAIHHHGVFYDILYAGLITLIMTVQRERMVSSRKVTFFTAWALKRVWLCCYALYPVIGMQTLLVAIKGLRGLYT